jgi:CheY-like chemotaxis protein
VYHLAMPGKLEGKRILVVEDDWFLSDVTSQGLSDEGATVVGPASDAPEALELLDREGPFDAAVVDYSLRGKPSTELVEELVSRKIKVLLVTGYGDFVKPLPIAQKVRFLSKPAPLDDLVKALGEMFS